MARFESLRITTDGAALAIRHYAGGGDPIELLHGGPGMGDYFDSFPEVLSPPYRVVSYNQRGCGPSSCDGHSTSRNRSWISTRGDFFENDPGLLQQRRISLAGVTAHSIHILIRRQVVSRRF